MSEDNHESDDSDNEMRSGPVLGADEYFDRVSDKEAAIENYTAILSRIEHDHGPFKSLNNDDDDPDGPPYSSHDLRGRFNVRDEFVKSHLFSQTNDHLAVYEMAYRADSGEFRGHESMIFRDIDADTDESEIEKRWMDIRQFAGFAGGRDEAAPTPPEARERLHQLLEVREARGDQLEAVPTEVKEAAGTLPA